MVRARASGFQSSSLRSTVARDRVVEARVTLLRLSLDTMLERATVWSFPFIGAGRQRHVTGVACAMAHGVMRPGTVSLHVVRFAMADLAVMRGRWFAGRGR